MQGTQVPKHPGAPRLTNEICRARHLYEADADIIEPVD
jgi:hypothetical protein